MLIDYIGKGLDLYPTIQRTYSPRPKYTEHFQKLTANYNMSKS